MRLDRTLRPKLSSLSLLPPMLVYACPQLRESYSRIDRYKAHLAKTGGAADANAAPPPPATAVAAAAAAAPAQQPKPASKAPNVLGVQNGGVSKTTGPPDIPFKVRKAPPVPRARKDGKVQCECGGWWGPPGTAAGAKSFRAHIMSAKHMAYDSD